MPKTNTIRWLFEQLPEISKNDLQSVHAREKFQRPDEENNRSKGERDCETETKGCRDGFEVLLSIL